MCDVCEPRVSARRVRREAFNIARSEGEVREEDENTEDEQKTLGRVVVT